MGLIHLTRVFTTYVGDTCVRVFEGSSSRSSLDPLQIVSNITLAHSHFQFSTRGQRLRLSCKLGCEARRGLERCRQLIVAAAGVNLVKLVLEIPLNTQTMEKKSNFQKLKTLHKTRGRKSFVLQQQKRERVFFSRFDCNNITLKVRDNVMQRYHLLKDIYTVGETIGRIVQSRILSATPKNRCPLRCSLWPTSHPSPQTIACQ
jgi:hypothetical protein